MFADAPEMGCPVVWFAEEVAVEVWLEDEAVEEELEEVALEEPETGAQVVRIPLPVCWLK